MKSLFFLTLSSLLFSCNQKVANEGKKLPDIFDNVYVTDNTEIISNWTMCSASGHGMMTQYNVCPTVSFLNNGTGYFGNSSILAERFTWTLKKRALNIFYKDTGSNSTFLDTFYTASISKQNERLNLVISQIKKDNSYYLSK